MPAPRNERDVFLNLQAIMQHQYMRIQILNQKSSLNLCSIRSWREALRAFPHKQLELDSLVIDRLEKLANMDMTPGPYDLSVDGAASRLREIGDKLNTRRQGKTTAALPGSTYHVPPVLEVLLALQASGAPVGRRRVRLREIIEFRRCFSATWRFQPLKCHESHGGQCSSQFILLCSL